MTGPLSAPSVSIVIPTKNRPEKLERCLTAIAACDDAGIEEVVVCDSSTDPELALRVVAVCAQFPFARLSIHQGKNVAAARNACVRAARTDHLINVDDDIRLEKDSLVRLLDHYLGMDGYRVVAGSVKWDDWSAPVKTRLIGYGRAVRDGETPDFLIGAFFAYPRQLGLAKPWNDHIRSSDDRLMGALWRSHDVELGFCKEARAVHDVEVVSYGVEHQLSHIYTNLFDAVIANPDPVRAACYQVLGFVWGAKASIWIPNGIPRFVSAWVAGNRLFLEDRAYLTDLARTPLPAFEPRAGIRA